MKPRTIKFRVWDKQSKELSYDGDRFFLKPNGRLGDWYDGEASRAQDSYVVQLNTGVTDQNGKEIYEGDICHAKKANSYLDGNYEVAWHHTKGRWYYKGQPEYKDLYQVGCAGNLKCTVVGNIFENPELLTN